MSRIQLSSERLIVCVLKFVLIALLCHCSTSSGRASRAGRYHPELAIRPGSYQHTPDDRVARAVQVRVWDSVVRAAERIAPDLLAEYFQRGFEVHSMNGTTGPVHYRVCPADNCRFTVDVPASGTAVSVGFVPQDQFEVRARVTVHGEVPVEVCPVGLCDDRCSGFLCPGVSRTSIVFDSRRGSHPTLGVRAQIALRTEQRSARQGYFAPIVTNVFGTELAEIPGEQIESDDFLCRGSFCDVFDSMRPSLIEQIRQRIHLAGPTIEETLAEHGDHCPSGTRSDGTHCRYTDGSFVSRLLGLELSGDLSALLSSVITTATTPGSVVFAAGDPAHAVEVSTHSVTSNLWAGVHRDRHHACVPARAAPTIPAVPELRYLRSPLVPLDGGAIIQPDAEIAISESFVNYALFQAWDGGLFCARADTQWSRYLVVGAVTMVLPTLAPLVFPIQPAPTQVRLRPQFPPRVRFGNGTDPSSDPLVFIEWNQLAVDLYVWSEERYVRFMTVTFNVSLGANLEVDHSATPQRLRLRLGNSVVHSAVVSNTQLIDPIPERFIQGIGGLIAAALGLVNPYLPNVALPVVPLRNSLGNVVGNVDVSVAANGLRRVSEGSENFLFVPLMLRYRR